MGHGATFDYTEHKRKKPIANRTWHYKENVFIVSAHFGEGRRIFLYTTRSSTLMAVDPLDTSHALQPAGHYRLGAIALHWATFVLVLTVGVLGLLHDSWPKQSQAFWINVHALIGILLWVVLLARFGYRRRHSPPTLPSDIGAFSRRFSSPVHLTLYALMFIIPVIGFLTFIYHGRIFRFGLFDLNFGIKENPAIFEPTEDIHGYLAYALFALASLHALVALWHHFIRRDGVLGRMWPAKGAGPGP
jgi:cytochrome b561